VHSFLKLKVQNQKFQLAVAVGSLIMVRSRK